MKPILGLILLMACVTAKANDFKMKSSKSYISEEVYFELTDGGAVVTYPYNFLYADHPLKKQILPELDKHFDELRTEWMKFYVDYSDAHEPALEKILNEESAQQAAKTKAYLQKNPVKTYPSLKGRTDLAKLRLAKMRAKANSNILSEKSKTLTQMKEEVNQDYKRQMALMTKDLSKYRENFVDTVNRMADIPTYQTDLMDDLNAPDIYMVQFHGNFFQKLLVRRDKLRADKANKAAQVKAGDDVDKKRVEAGNRPRRTFMDSFDRFLKINPLTKALSNSLIAVSELHRYRLVFLIRPVIVKRIDFATGQSSETVEFKHSFNILLNVNNVVNDYEVHDTQFFRLSLGGIWGRFADVNSMNSVFSGLSLNPHPNFNAKVGAITTVDAFKRKTGYGMYVLLGGQHGLQYTDRTPLDPNDDSKKRRAVKKKKMEADLGIMVNFAGTVERMGLDNSGLHAKVLELIGALPKRNLLPPINGGSPVMPIFRPGTGGTITGTGNTHPIFSPVSGGDGTTINPGFFTSSVYTDEELEQLIMHKIPCNETCQKRYDR